MTLHRTGTGIPVSTHWAGDSLPRQGQTDRKGTQRPCILHRTFTAGEGNLDRPIIDNFSLPAELSARRLM